MPLDEYRRKRDFATSPEPSGSERPRARAVAARAFCVQKHLATQLHYDFRLEHGGVLLSWAVPKGPSIDPTVKRFAAHVEDHPLEYGDFEGVIPEGYGAGVVMLWDRGTWEPEVDDVDAALARGDLKLRLDGYKLKGSWALVRTHGFGRGRRGGSPDGGTGESWLLIKHRDEWAGPIDIAAFAPLSVKSGGDFDDILAAEAPAVWTANPKRQDASLAGSLAKIVEKVERFARDRDAQAGDSAAAPEPGPAEPRATGRPRAPRRRPRKA